MPHYIPLLYKTVISVYMPYIGPDGVEEVHSFGPLSDFEAAGLAKILPDLIGQVNKGKDFAK